jgi:hypothetical protein
MTPPLHLPIPAARPFTRTALCGSSLVFGWRRSALKKLLGFPSRSILSIGLNPPTLIMSQSLPNHIRCRENCICLVFECPTTPVRLPAHFGFFPMRKQAVTLTGMKLSRAVLSDNRADLLSEHRTLRALPAPSIAYQCGFFTPKRTKFPAHSMSIFASLSMSQAFRILLSLVFTGSHSCKQTTNHLRFL